MNELTEEQIKTMYQNWFNNNYDMGYPKWTSKENLPFNGYKIGTEDEENR